MTIPRVFLDTCTVKHSFRRKRGLRPRLQKVEWNGAIHEIVIHDFVTTDPASRITNPVLKREIDLLSEIAALARAKAIELLWHHEADIEFSSIWLIPSGGRPELLDAGIIWVKSPVPYSRMLHSIRHGTDEKWKDVQVAFLKGLRHPRYLQLQKACGADQGFSVNANQLIDAFHVWCAESAGATHFLTTDSNLIRLMRQHKRYPPKVKVVAPTELISELQTRVPQG